MLRLRKENCSGARCAHAQNQPSAARFIPESADLVAWSRFSDFGGAWTKALRVVRSARLGSVTVVQEVMRLDERHGFYDAWLQRV